MHMLHAYGSNPLSRSSSQMSGSNPVTVELQFSFQQNSRLQRLPSQVQIAQHNDAINLHEQQASSNLLEEKVEQHDDTHGYEHSQHEQYLRYGQMCKDVEFVQMLGNPRYVLELLDRGYFYSKDFREYINGLKYFLKRVELRRLIKYPEGLYNLEMMLRKGFVEAMQSPQFRDRFVLRGLRANLGVKGSRRRWRDLDGVVEGQLEAQLQEAGQPSSPSKL